MEEIELMMDNSPSQKDMDNSFLNACVQSLDKAAIDRAEIKSKVFNMWKSKNTLNELLEILQEYHEGDRTPMMVLLLAFIEGYLDNMEETVYFTIHAEAGEGKSHIFQTVARILPNNKVWDGGFSNKFLTRAKELVLDGSLICLDDIDQSEELIEIQKICSNRCRNPIYAVLEGTKNEPKIYEYPKRLTFITIKVDSKETKDFEQIKSRNITVFADSDSVHKERVFDLIRERAAIDYTQNTMNLEIFKELFWEDFPPHFEVDASICSHLGCTKGVSARQIEQCISLIKLFAIYHHWDGSRVGKVIRNNAILLKADRTDFNAAIELYNDLLRGIGGDQVFNLTPTANNIRLFLIRNYPNEIKKYVNFEELAKEMGMNDANGRKAICRALYGREDSKGKERTKHVLGTVPGLTGDPYSETVSDNELNPDGKYSRKTFKKYPIIWDGNEYQKACPNSLAFYWTSDEFRKYGN